MDWREIECIECGKVIKMSLQGDIWWHMMPDWIDPSGRWCPLSGTGPMFIPT